MKKHLAFWSKDAHEYWLLQPFAGSTAKYLDWQPAIHHFLIRKLSKHWHQTESQFCRYRWFRSILYKFNPIHPIAPIELFPRRSHHFWDSGTVALWFDADQCHCIRFDWKCFLDSEDFESSIAHPICCHLHWLAIYLVFAQTECSCQIVSAPFLPLAGSCSLIQGSPASWPGCSSLFSTFVQSLYCWEKLLLGAWISEPSTQMAFWLVSWLNFQLYKV